jgi:hypothetical protein
MAGIPACATDPKRPRCHDGTPETNGRISMSYSRSPLGPWSTKVALAIGGVPDSQWNCKHNNPSALIESDGRILLMYMRNRQFLSTVYIQMIILPRQAWDKHRKTQKEPRFLAGTMAHRAFQRTTQRGWCENDFFVAPFYAKPRGFAKTGSGQT